MSEASEDGSASQSQPEEDEDISQDTEDGELSKIQAYTSDQGSHLTLRPHTTLLSRRNPRGRPAVRRRRRGRGGGRGGRPPAASDDAPPAPRLPPPPHQGVAEAPSPRRPGGQHDGARDRRGGELVFEHGQAGERRGSDTGREQRDGEQGSVSRVGFQRPKQKLIDLVFPFQYWQSDGLQPHFINIQFPREHD